MSTTCKGTAHCSAAWRALSAEKNGVSKVIHSTWIPWRRSTNADRMLSRPPEQSPSALTESVDMSSMAVICRPPYDRVIPAKGTGVMGRCFRTPLNIGMGCTTDRRTNPKNRSISLFEVNLNATSAGPDKIKCQNPNLKWITLPVIFTSYRFHAIAERYYSNFHVFPMIID